LTELLAGWPTGITSTPRFFHSTRLAIVFLQSTTSFQLENWSFFLPLAPFPVISVSFYSVI